MDISAYKRAVTNTTQAKNIKAGLRHITKNTGRAILAHSVIGLKTEAGELLRSLTPYILGEQLRPEAKDLAKTAFACYGYFLVMGARVLKTKLPSASKKVKLVGTRTQALLDLDSTSTEMLSMVGEYMGGLSNGAPTEDHDTKWVQSIGALYDKAVAQFWPLVYDTLGATPDAVFQHDFDFRKEKYPVGFFDDKPAAPKEAAPAEAAPATGGEPETKKVAWKPGQKKAPPAAATTP